MRINIEIINGSDTPSILDSNIFGANGDKVLYANICKVFLKFKEHLLASLSVDYVVQNQRAVFRGRVKSYDALLTTILGVRRKPRINPGAGNKYVLRPFNNNAPRLIAAAKLVIGRTLVARVA